MPIGVARKRKLLRKLRTYKSNVRTSRFLYSGHILRGPGSIRNNEVVIRRTVLSPIVQTTTGVDEASNYYFQMSQVPNFSEISAMFKEIKLVNVVIKWVPVKTETTGSEISNVIYFAYNPNNYSTGAPTSATIREQNNCYIRKYTSTFTKKLHPVIKNQVGQAGISTYYTDIPCHKQWMPTESASVRFYGFDWVIPDNGTTATNPLGKFEITYKIACRFPK